MQQSDIELTVSRFSKIEQRLVNDLGATEKNGSSRTSFINRLSEVEHLFSAASIQRLRSIASLRNKLVHGDIASLPNREQFIKDCDMIDMAIDLAKEKRETFAGDRNTIFSSTRPVSKIRKKPNRELRRTPNAVVFFMAIVVLLLVVSFFSKRDNLDNDQLNPSGSAVPERHANDAKERIEENRQATLTEIKKAESVKVKVTKKRKGKDLNQLNQDDAIVLITSDNKDQKEGILEKGQAAPIETRSGESVQVEVTQKGVSTDLVGEYVFCKVTFSNLTDKNISAMRGNLAAIDSEGKVLHIFKIKLDSKYNEKIEANSTFVKVIGSAIGWNDDYSEFEEKDRLYKNTPLDNMKFSWQPEQIVYEDGTETAR